MGSERVLGPSPQVLVVGQTRASQGRAAADLVRPGEVAAVAATLAPWVGEGFAEAELVAGWLLDLSYLPDSLHRDVWQSPLATIARGGGDCEDLAIAALSVLVGLGCHGAIVVGIMYQRSGPIGHAWLEGWDSAGWFHIEATNPVVSRIGRPPVYIPYAIYSPSADAAAGG